MIRVRFLFSVLAFGALAFLALLAVSSLIHGLENLARQMAP